MSSFPARAPDVQAMLAAIGVKDLSELWAAVPEAVRLKRPLELPAPLSEVELERELLRLAETNRDLKHNLCFLGAGTYAHHVPALIPALLSRGEFLTAYTPYQAEVSQGTLQAMFEYQTLIAELTGMEVSNASMYDGAEAAAEAVLMAGRLRPKNGAGPILISAGLNPAYRRTIATYLAHSGRELKTIPLAADGTIDLARLRAELAGALCVVVQSPNFFGCVEDGEAVAAALKNSGAVWIAVVTEALSLALLKPPGHFGADIVAGEGQSFGIPASFGGPHLGFLAGREADVRRMPGRLVGETVDHEGRRGYVLTLSTREQHIRREKATSNICTNHGLMALAATIYLARLGGRGLFELARQNHELMETLQRKLGALGLRPRFSAPGFNEFTLELDTDAAAAAEKIARQGILAGLPLGRWFPEFKSCLLLAVTETLSEPDLDRLVGAFRELKK